MSRVFVFLAFIYALVESVCAVSFDVNIKNRTNYPNKIECDVIISAPDGWKIPNTPTINVNSIQCPTVIINSTEKQYVLHTTIPCNGASKIFLEINCPMCNKFCTFASKSIVLNTTSNSIWYYIVLGILGGLILNFMPCVLPIVLLKLRSIRTKRGLIGTICGNFLCFFFIICILLVLKSMGQLAGWGMHFQDTRFLIVAVIALFILLLHSFGILKFNIFVTQKDKCKSEFIGNIISGILSTLIAIPCTAPLLGIAATFAIQGTTFELISVFCAISLGFSLPYIVAFAFDYSFTKFSWGDKIEKIINLGVLITFLWMLYVLIQNLLSVPNNFQKAYRDIQIDVTNNRVVMLDITADWCLTCQYNHNYVFRDTRVQQAIQAHNVKIVTININKKNDDVMRFLHFNGRSGIPFTMILGPGAKDGIILDELPSVNDVINAINTASNESQ